MSGSVRQRTGIPKEFAEVRRAVEELGYDLKRVTGGHYIFQNENPVEAWGQTKMTTIPSVIKTTKTLRSILNNVGYFKAHHLKPDGSPAPEQTAIAVVDGLSSFDQRRTKAFYAWQKAVKQSLRAGSAKLPSQAQFEKSWQPPKS